MAYKVGVMVEAVGRVTERGFNGKRVFEHARPGERGEVVAVDAAGEWLTVTWCRGTTTDVHVSELRQPLPDGHEHAAPGTHTP